MVVVETSVWYNKENTLNVLHRGRAPVDLNDQKRYVHRVYHNSEGQPAVVAIRDSQSSLGYVVLQETEEADGEAFDFAEKVVSAQGYSDISKRRKLDTNAGSFLIGKFDTKEVILRNGRRI